MGQMGRGAIWPRVLFSAVFSFVASSPGFLVIGLSGFPFPSLPPSRSFACVSVLGLLDPVGESMLYPKEKHGPGLIVFCLSLSLSLRRSSPCPLAILFSPVLSALQVRRAAESAHSFALPPQRR